MKQCTNCKCQVGSGIAVCPYCGASLPLDEPADKTMIAVQQVYPADRLYTIEQHFNSMESQTSSESLPARNMLYIPVQQLPDCASCRGNARYSSVTSVLLTLLICMMVANVLQFAALLLLLL